MLTGVLILSEIGLLLQTLSCVCKHRLQHNGILVDQRGLLVVILSVFAQLHEIPFQIIKV